MNRPIQIAPPGGSAPPATFEQPFAMLEACHERVHGMLDLLGRLQTHLASHGADEQARDAARAVMRYFDLAAPQHHLDEERHVLPALERSGDAALVALAERLRRDHRQMELGWAAARAVLAAVQDGSLANLQPMEAGQLQQFAELYAGHITAEESIAFPAAEARLDAGQVQAMSADMVDRRTTT